MENISVRKLLFRLAPPVMLALLIQSVYNIVDSYFVARYSAAGLTALSIIFPVQLLMTAFATGTGAGLNIILSRMDGLGETERQRDILKSGLFLGILNYLIFVCLGLPLTGTYFRISSGQADVRQEGICYAGIILIGSFAQFIEANCTKSLQARGDMFTPMAAQITGALINVVMDPVLIFGKGIFPELGTGGAALATVAGQTAAMLITFCAVKHKFRTDGRIYVKDCIMIYRNGLPSIFMQSLYTFYIIGLNLILKQFTENAVTVLGIYYKLQTFFFIPLFGLEQVLLPVISYNYGAGQKKRIKELVRSSLFFACSFMLAGTVVFLLFPRQLLSLFSSDKDILKIGSYALRVIGLSFVPAGAAAIYPVFFQGTDRGGESMFLTVFRQVLLLVPLAWLFHFAGLKYVWYTFPVTEIITLLMSVYLYKNPLKNNF